ncbi:response regulator [uncultured Nocardioides sp.]|uniref:hybrid sensor histidine kinase/response regulator n=1 Tax=uncultured Nocardioides sp. TaxID=198441 RepID=UPI002609DCC6|nr:response regulator [uncultured Nocardioides sp.]
MSLRGPHVAAFVALSAVTIVLVLVHLVQPTGPIGDATYLAAVCLAPLVATVGTLRAPRGQRRVPALIAVGLGCSALGDLIWVAYSWAGTDPVTSIADVPYYASYLGLGAAMLAIVLPHRHDSRRVDVDAAIDSLTVVVVSVLILWSVAVSSILVDDSMTVPTRTVLAGYPVLDAVLLALVLRVLSMRHRDASGILLATGIGCWLVSDLGYLLFTVDGLTSALLDAGWMTGALLMAGAACLPQVPADASEPDRTLRASLGQLGLAILPLLVPPALLVVAHLRGEPFRPGLTVGATLAVVAVTSLRMSRLLVVEGRMRRELGVARDEALAGSRAKSDFLATMSHEIRTPMNGVIGLTELLLTTPLDERQKQYAEGVRSAGHNLLGVINEILDFSKIEAGFLELEVIDFDPVELVESVAELIGEPATNQGLELLAYCSPELPTVLRGDPQRIRQVLLNLAGNAVKFTASGEVVVRASVDHRGETGLVARFEVTDTGTGIGIEPDQRDRLFEAFSQADSSTTRRFGGTGLGLAICRRLVEAMGGRLGVDSEPGAGSTFWFTVPLDVPTEPEQPALAPTARSTSPLTGLRVLVVDDNATNRAILHDQLLHWGMAPEVVDGAVPALARWRAAVADGRPYDLAVLDLCMPGIDGLELARSAAAEPDLAATGVVMMTSGPDVSPAEAEAASIDAALTKPVLMSRLRGTLERVVSARSPEPPSEPEPADAVASKGTVLVVDDGEVNQIVAVGMLRHLGYAAEVAEDGHQAIEAVRRRRYDAILMDVQMPGMDGYDSTREIRRLEGDGARTPIIAMTASVTEGEIERCLAAGMDDYQAKPVQKAAIAEVLNRWVLAP